MSYSATITTRIPAWLYRIACAIAKALDTDTAGERNYGPQTLIDADGNEYTPEFYSSTVPCTPDFAAQVPVLLANPAMLHAVVTEAYADRWPDLSAPTLAECEAFCAGAVLVLPPSTNYDNVPND